jgi:hypothetical protein
MGENAEHVRELADLGAAAAELSGDAGLDETGLPQESVVLRDEAILLIGARGALREGGDEGMGALAKILTLLGDGGMGGKDGHGRSPLMRAEQAPGCPEARCGGVAKPFARVDHVGARSRRQRRLRSGRGTGLDEEVSAQGRLYGRLSCCRGDHPRD